MNRVYYSIADAKRVAAQWRRDNPGAKYQIRPYALGNRVAYQIVQVNRYSSA